MTSGKLNSYLTEIDEWAENMFSRLVKEMAVRRGVIEQLKVADQMAWVGKTNAIRNSAMKIINDEIYLQSNRNLGRACKIKCIS